MPSKRIYDCEKDEFVIRNIVELESGQHIKKVCVAEYKYSLDDILGQGFSSTVYKATLRDNNKQKYAIKVIDLKKFKQDSSVALLDMEVEMNVFKSGAIPSIYGSNRQFSAKVLAIGK